jgi:hypothetical protein
MVEMIIMLMMRTSPTRSEARRRRLREGLLWGLRRWFAIQKETQLLRWHDKGRKELNKYGKFRHPADAAQWGNINTHGLTTQGAYGLLWAQMAWTHSVTRAQLIAPGLSCCRCTTFHPSYARNINIWCW